MKKAGNGDYFFEMKHRYNNPGASFESIIYVTMHKQKAPINMRSKQQIAITDMREKAVDFVKGTTRASSLALAIIWLTLDP